MAKFYISDFVKQDYPVTQEYGQNKEYYANISGGILKNGHEGVDFATPTGTEVFAPFTGIIVRDAFSAKDYGNFVVVWDSVQLCAVWFCHLQDVVVQIGDKVTVGQLIAHTNNTGNSTGPHCHVNFVETDSNGYRLNSDNGSEGFLNILDPELVEWRPFGSQEKPQEPVLPPTKYQVGQTIETVENVPVGQAPGQESMDYGHIGVGFPARIMAIGRYNNALYYNIDQAAIGGGTGWVSAATLDLATVYQKPLPDINPLVLQEKPQTGGGGVVDTTAQTIANTTPAAVPSLPVEPPVAPAPTVQAAPPLTEDLVKQRDDALNKLKEVTEKLQFASNNYSAFVAMGYNTIDDLKKVLDSKDGIIEGTKKELAQILRRNEGLAIAIAGKEKEDYTAIEDGMAAVDELKSLRQDLTTIAKAHGTKPKLEAILAVVDEWKITYKTLVAQLRKKDLKQSIEQANTQSPSLQSETPILQNSLFSLFGA